jgi:hypothetical protein
MIHLPWQPRSRLLGPGFVWFGQHGRAVVVPIAPPGSPRSLRAAIRLRRAAALSGRCPSCGGREVDPITPSGAALGLPDPGPLTTIDHRPKCAASDAQLANALYSVRR